MANELRVIGFAAGRALGKEKGGFASVMARAGGDADSAFRGGTRFPACEVGTNFLPVFMRSKAHATSDLLFISHRPPPLSQMLD
jgi:hypothetical protein